MITKKVILDSTCGGRMMWFDKKNPRAVFIDKYPRVLKLKDRGKLRDFKVVPDMVMDFTELKFVDNAFKLIVFDPPHLKRLKESSYMRMKYGVLTAHWQEDILRGFNECWRVLDVYGTLIFKWHEDEIKISDVLKVIPVQPLFGHPTGKVGKTMWMCFMKFPEYKKPFTEKGGDTENRTSLS